MSRLRIVLFHPVRLPPRDYGGVERVVLWLARGLLERGHEVHVAALEGSQLPRGAQLIPMKPGAVSARELLPVLPSATDVVHFMAPPEEGVLEKLPAAHLLTLHGNGKVGERFIKNTVFLTSDHARRHGGSVYVFNGVDPEEYDFDPRLKDGRHLFLSKTSWKVKNVRGAIRLCSRARAALRVAGGNRPWDARLRVALEPRMSWEGPVAGKQKARLLAAAKSLVFPILWPEPFGLVIIEALVSGTPVIASRIGSVPELVGPDAGVGLDPSDEASWVDWLSKERLPFQPEACRAWALSRFTHRAMAQGYEEVYRRVIAGESLHPVEPAAKS